MNTNDNNHYSQPTNNRYNDANNNHTLLNKNISTFKFAKNSTNYSNNIN